MELSSMFALSRSCLPNSVHANAGISWRHGLQGYTAASLKVVACKNRCYTSVSFKSYGSSEIGFLQPNLSLVSTMNSSLLVPTSKKQAESQEDQQVSAKAPSAKHILCLSNGHGEDTIAVTVLKELQVLTAERRQALTIEALPLVGLGPAYTQAKIPIVGPSKVMPSGGFIYMDILQLLGDMRAGLLSLTLDQWKAIVEWLDKRPNGFIVAVGDIFPLALAWLASRHSRRKQGNNMLKYFFIGTAKSEFYLQTDAENPLKSPKRFHVESLLGGVYLPWECALMADSNCRLVAPRDCLTAKVLKRQLPASAQAKVQDLGNPMMDCLQPTGALEFLEQFKPGRFITLLPGSRPPEVHSNWLLLLEASTFVSTMLHSSKVIFLTPVVPSLEPEPFFSALIATGWQPQWWKVDPLGTPSAGMLNFENGHGHAVEIWQANNTLSILAFEKENATMVLLRGGFRDAVHWAEVGIATAGTGTEQLVGLGKPVFTLPGRGPQFTRTFAEAQSRLLGKSIFLCHDVRSLALKLREVLADEAHMSEIRENGIKRMGEAGSSKRIAEQLCVSIFKGAK